MKKILLLMIVLCIAIGLCSCSSTNAETPKSENTLTSETKSTIHDAESIVPAGTQPESGIYEDSVVVGNYEFKIPKGFSVNLVDNKSNAMLFESDNTDCTMLLVASDISKVSEKDLDKVFQACSETMALDNSDILEDNEVELNLAEKSIKVRSSIKQDEDLNLSICFDTAFTDSWYVYIIQMEMDSGSDKVNEYSKKLAHFTGFAKYLGESPRFDTIQLGSCSSTNIEAPKSENILTSETKSTIHDAESIVPAGTQPESGIYEDSVVVGNYKFKTPKGFSVNLVDNKSNAMLFESDDTDCTILLVASDISKISEKDLDKVFQACSETMALDNSDILEDNEVELNLAEKSIKVRSSIKQDEDLNLSICFDTAFTDSWYAYIIQMKMDSGSDKINEYSKKLVHFTGFAKYLGEPPRFDTIQQGN